MKEKLWRSHRTGVRGGGTTENSTSDTAKEPRKIRTINGSCIDKVTAGWPGSCQQGSKERRGVREQGLSLRQSLLGSMDLKENKNA